MEMDNFWGTVTGIFIGIMVLAGVIVVVKIIVFATSPQLSSDPTALCKFGFYKFFVSSLEIFSNLAFWFLVITTGYWFVFFKLQERVYVLLPTVDSDSDYKPFEALFFVVVSTKFLSLLLKIRAEQCSFDVYLIDWEKPKLEVKNARSLIVNNNNEEVAQVK